MPAGTGPVMPRYVQEATKGMEDYALGAVVARLLKHSRTADDAAMRAVLIPLTPEQRAELACVGADLVELCNEIGAEQSGAAHVHGSFAAPDPQLDAAAAVWTREAAALGLPGQCPACRSWGAPLPPCPNPWHAARDAQPPR